MSNPFRQSMFATYVSNSGGATVNTITLETGLDTIRSRYQASLFGGKERIIATMTLSAAYADTDTVVVRVPGLVLLPEGDTYDKVGGTCRHHGPRNDTLYRDCRTPDDDHWIDPEACDSLVSAAEDFLNGEWNRARERMRINDVSLPQGGLFDVNGDWHGPHVSHRIGKDVDIENRGRLQQLRRTLERRGWLYIPEGPTFFPHFRFGQ